MSPARSILRPPGDPGAFRGPVALGLLSSGERLLAFRRESAPGVSDLCVAPEDGAPNAERIERVVLRGGAGSRVVDYRFGPGGRHLLVSLRGTPGQTAFAVVAADPATEAPVKHVSAASAALWPAGDALVVAAPGGRLEEHSLSGSAPPRLLARIEDEGHPRMPVVLAPSPDARRVAVVSRSRSEDVVRIDVVPRDGGEPMRLAEIPGWVIRVRPFWSPDGESLALHLVHMAFLRTAILVLPGLEGGGELWYEADFLDPDHAPAWSPDGRALAFFRVAGSIDGILPTGPASLVRFDVEAHLRAPVRVDVRDALPSILSELTPPGAVDGRPFYLDGRTLVVEAHDGAHLFTFDEA